MLADGPATEQAATGPDGFLTAGEGVIWVQMATVGIEWTERLADLTAKRNQLEANVRSHRDRLARLDQEIVSVQADEQRLAQETAHLGDLDALAAALEAAEEAVSVAEART